MSEIASTDVIENEEGPNATTNVNNEDFSAIIIAVVLLICLWMLAGFTVFKYATLTVIMIHFLKTFRLNSTSNRNETRTTSFSQICIRRSSTMRSNSSYSSSSIDDDSTMDKVKESKAVPPQDDEHRETVSPMTERETSNDDSIQQGTATDELVNSIKQISESDGNQITNLIQNSETVAVLITSVYENSTSDQSPVQQPTDSTASTRSSNASSIAGPIATKSAFVTENKMRVAVSYSGKERKRVLKITRILQRLMTTPECLQPVFFDQDFQHEICRLNGSNHLQSIYRQAQLVIVFLSPTYANSKYCYDEWRTIVDRFLSNPKNKESTQLLLIKLGEYDMQELGLFDRDFPLNGMRRTNEDIAKIIFQRWETIEKNLEGNDQ